MNRLKPTLQSVWKLPAVLNFTLGGIGGGLYLTYTLLLNLGYISQNLFPAYVLFSMGFILLGLIFVSLEAGRPLRAKYLLKNLRRSWMSRETLAIYLFLTFCLLDMIFPLKIFEIIGLFAAVLLLITHGMIIYSSRGLPAWNVWLAVPLIFISSLLAGNAVLLIANIAVSVNIYFSIFTLSLLLMSSSFWIIYLFHGRSNTEFQFATTSLRKAKSLIIIIGFGHILPVFLILMNLYLVYYSNVRGPSEIIIDIAGVLIILKAFCIRFGIIRQAGYFRRINITETTEMTVS